MVASSVRCALISGCKGQTSFPSSSDVLESKGTSTRLEVGHYGSSRWLLLQSKTSGIRPFVLPRRAIIVSEASNSRVTAAKQVASKGRNDREPNKSSGEVPRKGKNEMQQAKTRTSSPASSSEGTSTTRQVVVKGGFAGLSALKAQLEKERPRISRVNLNEVGGEFLRQQKQAELRRREDVVKSATSPKSEINMGTSATTLTPSSDEPISEGGTTLIRVTNLAKQVTEEEYRFIMQSIPEVSSWKYFSDRGGQCLGHGFCEVQAKSDIEAIMHHLSKQVLHGKKMKASLSERPGEYEESLGRQTKPAVTTTSVGKEGPLRASSSSSVKDRPGSPTVRKQAGLRDVWMGQRSSREYGTTEIRSAEDSSQDLGTPRGGKLDENWTERKTEMEVVQNMTSSVRDAAGVISNSSVDSLQGLNSHAGTKLTGKSVLEALQRAAALRDSRPKPRKRKGGSGGGKYNSDSDSEDDTRQGPLPPLVFKLEWATKIEELENDVKQLRLLS